MRRLLLCCMLSGMAYSMWAQERQNLVVYEDRIWEYTCRTTGTFRNKTIKAKFEGTETIEGKEYARFCLLSSVEWKPWDMEIVEYRDYSTESIGERCIGYIREEDGKVYTFCYMSLITGEEDQEYLIFDVNSPGEPVKCEIRWRISDSFMPGEIELSEAESLTNTGTVWESYRVNKACIMNDYGDPEDCWEFTDPDLMFVRGIGPCCIPYGGGGTVLGFEPKMLDTGGGNGYGLNNVYDLEGNVIFKGRNEDIPMVGVSVTVADYNGMTIVYDLTGREVARGENATDGLTPGIYIVRKGNIATKTVIK